MFRMRPCHAGERFIGNRVDSVAKELAASNPYPQSGDDAGSRFRRVVEKALAENPVAAPFLHGDFIDMTGLAVEADQIEVPAHDPPKYERFGDEIMRFSIV